MRTSLLLLSGAALASTISATEDSSYVTTYPSYTTDFTIINNQTHTPGHLFINSPAPWDVVGGDALKIQLDITAGGNLPLPPYAKDAENAIHSISIFLTSIITGLNLTISNSFSVDQYKQQFPDKITPEYLANYDAPYNSTLPLYQEPKKAVKTVNFRWPLCFVSVPGFSSSVSGEPGYGYRGGKSVGAYNISIHQSSRISGVDTFSVFNLPIIIREDIGQGEEGQEREEQEERVKCFQLKSGKMDSDNWGEGEDWFAQGGSAYPWAEGKGMTKVESKSVEEWVSWPEEESEEETLARVGRDLTRKKAVKVKNAVNEDVKGAGNGEGEGKSETQSGNAPKPSGEETSTSEAALMGSPFALVSGILVAGIMALL